MTFLKDLETFSFAVRGIIGMEKEKIKVFDDLVSKVRHQLSSNSDHKNNKEEGDGVADLFRSAVVAVTTDVYNNIHGHSNSSFCPSSSQKLTNNDNTIVGVVEEELEIVTERGKKRASSLLKSLYVHGHQHGEAMALEDKKKKERREIGNKNRGHYPSHYADSSVYISSSNSKRQHSQISISNVYSDAKEGSAHQITHQPSLRSDKKSLTRSCPSEERPAGGIERQFHKCHFSLKDTDIRFICDISKPDSSNKMKILTQSMRLRAEAWLYKKIEKIVKLPESCVVCSKCYSLISYHKV